MPAKRANRPRRQAKQDRARETVHLLLEAAARVLQERGYAGATTNRIAQVAGTGVGTLYEYFANKDWRDEPVGTGVATEANAIENEEGMQNPFGEAADAFPEISGAGDSKRGFFGSVEV